MSNRADAFDHWIRTSFVAMNTELEELYFASSDRAAVQGIGDPIKARLHDEGHSYVVDLWQEGNTGEGFESAFGVLGNVGLYMGALRRHELTNPDRDERSPFAEASSLALIVGASIGMAPRFATAHLATHNFAIAGRRKSFTALADEFLFIDENTRGILSFQRTADALSAIVPLGVSNPAADVLFEAAIDGLREVMRANDRLFDNLDVDRFFYSVRPYYKPYHVGRNVYRGANAGDFSGINEIDLLLGLCRASDTYYANLLVDKMLFMLPADQARLRECMTHRSLLDEFLRLADAHADAAWFQRNARLFLEVCDLFGQAAAQHHDRLVSRFIIGPAGNLDDAAQQGITASGPPLPALIRSLEILRDYRTAAPDAGPNTRHADLARLRDCLMQEPPSEPDLALVAHQPAAFALPVACLLALALVVDLLALGERNLDFRPPPLIEVEFQGHDGHAVALHGADQPVHLTAVQEKLSRALRLVVEAVGLQIFRDVGVDQPDLAAFRANV